MPKVIYVQEHKLPNNPTLTSFYGLPITPKLITKSWSETMKRVAKC